MVGARMVIGCMTGTSMDGIDAAIVQIVGSGLQMSVRFVEGRSRSLDSIETCLALAAGEPVSAPAVLEAAVGLGKEHAGVICELVQRHGEPALIVLHGQTVWHQAPLSWQLLNPWPVVAVVRAPIVFDLRGADLAAGGQGAPVTPLADWILFRSTTERRAVVNLGGFCNITIIDAGQGPEAVRGMDVCACNQLLDAVARRRFGSRYDDGGRWAASGRVEHDSLDELLVRLRRQSTEGRSLGSGDELGEWIGSWEARLSPADMAATASEGIGRVIAEAVSGLCDRVLLAGGGVRHLDFVSRIERHCGIPVELTDAYDVPAQYREAAGMAVLGALCADGVPITLPQVTGARPPAPLAGSWINIHHRQMNRVTGADF